MTQAGDEERAEGKKAARRQSAYIVQESPDADVPRSEGVTQTMQRDRAHQSRTDENGQHEDQPRIHPSSAASAKDRAGDDQGSDDQGRGELGQAAFEGVPRASQLGDPISSRPLSTSARGGTLDP